MLLDLARNRKILFFGGKGGVGKTTVSSATALARANEGAKVLLVSTDPAHNLGHLFARSIGPQPVRITAGLDAMELDPDETIKTHIEEVSRALHQLMPVTQHAEIDKHMDLSRDAPGMHEAALLERIADIIKEGVDDYELIVFDTAPSGHTARLMVLPEMMSAWTEGLIKRRDKADRFAEIVRDMGKDASVDDRTIGGLDRGEREKESQIRQILLRRRKKFAHLRDSLSNSELCSFVIVLAAERLPVLESIELYQQLGKTGVDIGCLLVNKRSPENEGEFLTARRAQEDQHLATLDAAISSVPRQEIALAGQDVVGLEALEKFSRTLAGP